MRQLQLISCQPNDSYFIWQLEVQLHNFRKYGYSDKARILVYKHNLRKDGEDFMHLWKALEAKYPEAKFFYYEDPTGGLQKCMSMYEYIPLLRPWLLAKHFKEFPELKDDAIFYLDSDVVFTKKLDFTPLLEDDIAYLSDTRSYIGAAYLDSKEKDTLPDKLEQYKAENILRSVANRVGIREDIIRANQDGSGGAQYLLKNIDHEFWEQVFVNCIEIRTYFRSVNRRYFENEDRGIQSWCADMWAVLWTLWKRGTETKCPLELDFAWATDDISKWDRVYLYHDAGASTRPVREGHRLFHKRELKYVNNEVTPMEEDLSFVSPEYCSKNYVKEIEEAANKESYSMQIFDLS